MQHKCLAESVSKFVSEYDSAICDVQKLEALEAIRKIAFSDTSNGTLQSNPIKALFYHVWLSDDYIQSGRKYTQSVRGRLVNAIRRLQTCPPSACTFCARLLDRSISTANNLEPDTNRILPEDERTLDNDRLGTPPGPPAPNSKDTWYDSSESEQSEYGQYFVCETLKSIVLDCTIQLTRNVMDSTVTVIVQEMLHKIDTFLTDEQRSQSRDAITDLLLVIRRNGWDGTGFARAPEKEDIATLLACIVEI